MLNVYDIRIDQSGTNAASSLIGNVVFDSSSAGRLVLESKNVKESPSRLYYTNARVRSQIISYGATAGGYPITLIGNVTGSGTGTISTTIANSAVTYTKIQNVAGNKILGNVGALGNVEELETTSGIILSGKTIGLALSGVTANSYNFLTVNNRGIVTAATNKPYLTGNQTISVTGDATGSGSTGLALTLATVNGNIGTFNNITINAKGLATAGSNKDYITNQTVTLSGDIAGAGSSGISTTIQANAVTTTKINNAAVTYAKIQNITANRILGRVTSTGVIQELALSSGLAFSGASIMAVGGGSGNVMLTGDVTGSGSNAIATTIANGVVTYAKIQNVAGNKILGNVGGAGAVEELALTSGLSLSGKTIGITTNGVTNTMLRQSAGVSIIGRSANSTGNVADITAASDGLVLKRVGGVVGFNGIGISDLPLSGVSASTYNFVTVNNKGLVTAGQSKNYITGNQTITVTGDATASGSTGLALTLATVNSNIGTFNNITINAKGLATAGSNKDYTTNQTITVTGDATGSGSSGIALTLATVNGNVGTFNNVTVNAKGLTTAASNKDYITNQTVTLSGDIAGAGSSGISTTIQPAAVTYSKIQNITANRILGKVGSTGVVQELALSSGLAFSGASIIAVGGGGGNTITLTGDVTGSGSAGITTTIANSAVTYSKIQNVTSNRILGNVGIAGIIEELALTSGLSFSGRTIFADYTNSPYKNVCRVTTTAALTVTYSNGASGVGATMTNAGALAALSIDSVALALGDRVLVKNQASTFQNGIYVVTNIGSGAIAWVLTRATDSDNAIKLYQASITVKEGTTFATTQWVNSNTSTAITVGTTGITYIISGAYVISSGLNLTNKTITISTAGVTRAMLSNAVGVSVIGRSANSTGVPADIAASSDGQVLKRVGGVVGFNAIGTNDINNSVITYAKIQNVAGNKILGNVGVAGAIEELETTSGLTLSGKTIGLANAGVTYAKIQNVTANRILGRVTSTGAIQELALSSGLAFSGASLTASATVTPAGSSGSLQFNNAGALGADANIFWNNTTKTLLLGGGGFFPNTTFNINGNINNFVQNNIRNSNAGGSASSDYIATADSGSQTTNYIDMGINSSTYNDGSFTISGALDGYLYTNGGNLVLGTQSTKDIVFHTNGTLAANKRGIIDSTGKWGMGNITPNTIVDVNGDVAIRKGIDYSSSGTFNNVPTTSTSNIRFTNNTAPTITGFGQGFDGKVLYVTNTGTGTLTIVNNSGSSLAANRILTGASADRLLQSGGTLQFIYDSASTVWRLQSGGSRMLNGSIAIAEASWSANTNYTIDITVTGAAVNDRVVVTITPSIIDSVNTASGGLTLNGYVISTNTVRVWGRVTQFTTTTGGTWYVTVLK